MSQQWLQKSWCNYAATWLADSNRYATYYWNKWAVTASVRPWHDSTSSDGGGVPSTSVRLCLFTVTMFHFDKNSYEAMKRDFSWLALHSGMESLVPIRMWYGGTTTLHWLLNNLKHHSCEDREVAAKSLSSGVLLLQLVYYFVAMLEVYNVVVILYCCWGSWIS